MKNLHTLSTLKLSITLLAVLLTIPAHADNDDMDPLNPAELAKATSLVQSNTPTATQRTLIAPASTTTPISEPELLLVERHINEKNQTGRLADVYKYDYNSNET